MLNKFFIRFFPRWVGIYNLTQKELKKSRLTRKKLPLFDGLKFGRMISKASSELFGLTKVNLQLWILFLEGRY